MNPEETIELHGTIDELIDKVGTAAASIPAEGPFAEIRLRVVRAGDILQEAQDLCPNPHVVGEDIAKLADQVLAQEGEVWSADAKQLIRDAAGKFTAAADLAFDTTGPEADKDGEDEHPGLWRTELAAELRRAGYPFVGEAVGGGQRLSSFSEWQLDETPRALIDEAIKAGRE